MEAQSMIPLPSDAAAGDLFGSSVAIDGPHAFVGSPRAGDYGTTSGGISTYRRDSTGWQLGSRLEVQEVGDFDQFGGAVAMSRLQAVVGARGDDQQSSNAGAAYVFQWGDTSWVEQAKLTVEESGADDQLGFSVDISNNYVLVGAPGHSVGDTLENAGAAYLFVRDSTGWRADTMLTAGQPEPGDHFGRAVALDGTYALVGARDRDTPERYAGAAYIFERSDEDWSLVETLTAPEPQADGYFGGSVAVSGQRALVGAWGEDLEVTNAGAVYSYARDSEGWNSESKITAPDPAPDDRFGFAVAMDTLRAVVGAVWSDVQGNGSGAAHVYEYADGQWQHHERFAPDSLQGGDEFGYAVALDEYGSVLVGARGTDGEGGDAGSAWIEESSSQTPVSREGSDLPSEVALAPNYPNPFNPSTTIPYRVAETTPVRLEVYDLRGRLVATLVDRVHAPGRYTVQWSGGEHPSGVYLYRLSTDKRQHTRSMILVK